MKLRFDADLPYQRDAIETTLAVFDGQPSASCRLQRRRRTTSACTFKNIFGEGELEEGATTEDYSAVQQEGKRRVKVWKNFRG
jgi:hypothetical protein